MVGRRFSWGGRGDQRAVKVRSPHAIGASVGRLNIRQHQVVQVSTRDILPVVSPLVADRCRALQDHVESAGAADDCLHIHRLGSEPERQNGDRHGAGRRANRVGDPHGIKPGRSHGCRGDLQRCIGGRERGAIEEPGIAQRSLTGGNHAQREWVPHQVGAWSQAGSYDPAAVLAERQAYRGRISSQLVQYTILFPQQMASEERKQGGVR